MIVRMHSTGRNLIGYDHESGRIVRRTIYEDGDGNQYVRLGRFAANDPDAHVSKQWFCDHIMTDGMIERQIG